MKKEINVILLILTVVFLSSCSSLKNEKENNSEPTKSITTTENTAITESTIIENTESPEIAETKPEPTVPDDLDYGEMFRIVDEDPRSKLRADDIPYEAGQQYAKKWVSTDGKISFVLFAKYGPFGSVSSDGKYTVDGKTYDVNVDTGAGWFSVEIETWDSHTKILCGEFSYNHDEQSFTVTAAKCSSSHESDPDEMLTQEYNAIYGDPTIPVYELGEKVTFKMVR